MQIAPSTPKSHHITIFQLVRYSTQSPGALSAHVNPLKLMTGVGLYPLKAFKSRVTSFVEMGF